MWITLCERNGSQLLIANDECKPSVGEYGLYSLVAGGQVAAVPVTAYESGPNQQTHINPTRLKSPCLDFLICNFFGLFCSSMDLQHCYFVLLFLHECISQCKCISEPCPDGGGLVWVRTKPLGPEYVIPALHFPNTRFPSNQRAGGGGGGAEG